jgi:hypothetical protein
MYVLGPKGVPVVAMPPPPMKFYWAQRRKNNEVVLLHSLVSHIPQKSSLRLSISAVSTFPFSLFLFFSVSTFPFFFLLLFLLHLSFFLLLFFSFNWTGIWSSYGTSWTQCPHPSSNAESLASTRSRGIAKIKLWKKEAASRNSPPQRNNGRACCYPHSTCCRLAAHAIFAGTTQ